MIGNRLNTTKWLFIHKNFISKDYHTTNYYGWNAYHQLQPNNILNTDNNNTTYHTIITEKELYKSRLAKLSKIVNATRACSVLSKKSRLKIAKMQQCAVEERSKSKRIEISLSAVSTACVHTLEPKSLVRFCLVCSKLMILYYKAQISIWPFWIFFWLYLPSWWSNLCHNQQWWCQCK